MIKFTPEQKEKIVLEYQNSNEGAKYFMKKYNIQKSHTIYKWSKIYTLYGISGFENKRGRKYKEIDSTERENKLTPQEEILRLKNELQNQKN